MASSGASVSGTRAALVCSDYPCTGQGSGFPHSQPFAISAGQYPPHWTGGGTGTWAGSVVRVIREYMAIPFLWVPAEKAS
jgi:hypothetical protein